jgi:hypothetical protein
VQAAIRFQVVGHDGVLRMAEHGVRLRAAQQHPAARRLDDGRGARNLPEHFGQARLGPRRARGDPAEHAGRPQNHRAGRQREQRVDLRCSVRRRPA